MDTTSWKIIEIMPADGWRAGMKAGSTIDYAPLVGWALVENLQNSQRFVTGLVAVPGGEVAFAVAFTDFHHFHRAADGVRW